MRAKRSKADRKVIDEATERALIRRRLGIRKEGDDELIRRAKSATPCALPDSQGNSQEGER
jgi:hypothetical protein